jgi:hypothetical protein
MPLIKSLLNTPRKRPTTKATPRGVLLLYFTRRAGRWAWLASSLTVALTTTTVLRAASDQAWALETPLVAYSATYSVGNDMLEAGEATVSLTRMDKPGQWQYSLSTRPTGLFKIAGRGHVRETAIFSVVQNNDALVLQPETYQFRQDKEQSRAVDATFNWQQRKIYVQRGNNQSTEVLQENTLDRMSMTVAMMSNLTPDFETFTLDVFDSGQIKQVEMINEGGETLRTKLGTLETVRIRTQNVAGSSRETLTWFAPSRNNLPVRIEQQKNGNLVARLSIETYAADQ